MMGDSAATMGSCARPQCQYHAFRCEWGYCPVCCREHHEATYTKEGSTWSHVRPTTTPGYYLRQITPSLLMVPAEEQAPSPPPVPTLGAMEPELSDEWADFGKIT